MGFLMPNVGANAPRGLEHVNHWKCTALASLRACTLLFTIRSKPVASFRARPLRPYAGRERAFVSAPIFISYSSADQRIAETICDAVQSRGHQCWIACRNVGPGENFQEAIVKAIRSAKLMILVFSGNANNSDEIKKEVVLAGRHRLTVVPVRVENVAPNDALAYEFATRQWVDLFKDWEYHMEQLASQIGQVLAGAALVGPGVPVETKPAERKPARRAEIRPLLAVAAIMAILVGAGGTYLSMRPATAPSSPGVPSLSTPSPSSPATPNVSTEEGEWLEADSAGTVPALRKYLERFPDGAHAAEAQGAIRAADDKEWSEADREDTTTKVAQYVEQFPDGAHVMQARRRIAELEHEADESAWQKAVNAGTVSAFKDYLVSFTSGAHAAEARQHVAELEAAAAPPANAQDLRRFDGQWTVTESCPKTAVALGFRFVFAATVKEGHLHGQHGVVGEPSSLTLDGQIKPDGTGKIFATGLTGGAAYSPDRAPHSCGRGPGG
jgi:TIR domain